MDRGALTAAVLGRISSPNVRAAAFTAIAIVFQSAFLTQWLTADLHNASFSCSDHGQELLIVRRVTSLPLSACDLNRVISFAQVCLTFYWSE